MKIFRKKIKKTAIINNNLNPKKDEFYLKIISLRENIQQYEGEFDIKYFEENFFQLLKKYNCSFGYQNKNSKKHGHVKRKINLQTGAETLELKIERNENLAGTIYTIIHELTHLLNDHLYVKNLTHKQKEVVADTVGLMFINYLNLNNQLKESMLSSKWNIDNYAKAYIYDMAFSKKREDLIVEQINNTYNYLKHQLVKYN